MARAYLPLTLLAVACTATAQVTFSEVTPTTAPYFATPADEDFWINSIAPADYDGDGRVDLAVIGFYVVYDVSVEDKLLLLHNDGQGDDGRWAFTTVELPLNGLIAGASDLAWGDYDGDGDHDLVVASGGATVLYRNDGGKLSATGLALPPYYEDSEYEDTYDLRSLGFADVDNDGDLDLLVPSVYDEATFQFSTRLLRNDGDDGAGGWTFTDVAAAIDPSVNAQSAWADEDGDGDLDLLLANVDPNTDAGFVRFYRNDADGFHAEDPLGIRLAHGLADMADVDADGDQDVLVAGNVQEPDETFVTVVRLYRKEAAGYVADDLIGAPAGDWLDFNAATWADYDSDGDVDLLVTGSYVGDGEIAGKSEIYANDGGTFTPNGVQLPAPIGSLGRGGAFTWFDLDGDGDLDYLVAGGFFVPGGNGLVEAQIHLFRNDAAAANAAPAAPTGLALTPSGSDGIALSWNAAVDDHTPAAQLTYDLALWRDSAPLALPERLPQPGSIGNMLRRDLTGLPADHYVWRVAAVDSAYAGSAPAGGEFTLPLAAEAIFADGFDPDR
jgi:hypothetical protein